jgi:DNA-binding NtrC family response regulator
MFPAGSKRREHHSPEESSNKLSDSEPGARRILIWDADGARGELVSRAVAACGATAARLEGRDAAARLEASPRGRLALVALDARSPQQMGDALVVCRALKQADFTVVSYGADSGSWPIGLRCRALLAGCAHLLDSGAADFEQELLRLLRQLLRREELRREEEQGVKDTMRRLGLIGSSPAMLAVFRRVLRLSPLSDLPVLLTGETGTGKELLANAIYQLDPKRRTGPFVVLNCGAVSQGVAESELFGHRRGSFTGAEETRRGLFRAAQGGVLFLDEIGELESGVQTKLLRVLQEGAVLGVGEDREQRVDVRVIAATNRNLEEMVGRGGFRADLFHRLNILSVHVPPLRERPDDLAPLVNHFLDKHRPLDTRGAATTAGADFVAALAGVGLPGNARELENLVRRALIGERAGVALGLEDLPPEFWRQLSEREDEAAASGGVEDEGGPGETSPAAIRSAASGDGSQLRSFFTSLLSQHGWNLAGALEYCEKLLLESALLHAHGNQSQMARLLGVTPRSIYNKVHKYRLHK